MMKYQEKECLLNVKKRPVMIIVWFVLKKSIIGKA